jgi:hypothetical protein
MSFGGALVRVMNLQLLSMAADAAGIILALVAVWLALSSVRASRANYERMLHALSVVSERSALTERTVGEQFEQLMGSVLNMAHAMAIGPDVRQAELERLGDEQHARLRSDTIKLLSEVIKWVDSQKVDAFVRIIETLESRGTRNFGPSRRRPRAAATAASSNSRE